MRSLEVIENKRTAEKKKRKQAVLVTCALLCIGPEISHGISGMRRHETRPENELSATVMQRRGEGERSRKVSSCESATIDFGVPLMCCVGAEESTTSLVKAAESVVLPQAIETVCTAYRILAESTRWITSGKSEVSEGHGRRMSCT